MYYPAEDADSVVVFIPPAIEVAAPFAVIAVVLLVTDAGAVTAAAQIVVIAIAQVIANSIFNPRFDGFGSCISSLPSSRFLLWFDAAGSQRPLVRWLNRRGTHRRSLAEHESCARPRRATRGWARHHHHRANPEARILRTARAHR